MKKNIVLIYSDEHRHDALGFAGHPVVKTPNLDRLAKNGSFFNRVWCQTPQCRPSRASFITGQYTQDLGLMCNDDGDMNPEWPTFMKFLQEDGYQTAMIGKTDYYSRGSLNKYWGTYVTVDMSTYKDFVQKFGWDYVLEEFDKGLHTVPFVSTPFMRFLEKKNKLKPYQDQLDHYFSGPRGGEVSVLDHAEELTSYLTQEAIDWVKNKRDRSKPFLLKLAYVQPHPPFTADQSSYGLYQDSDVELPLMSSLKAFHPDWERILDKLKNHSTRLMPSKDHIEEHIKHYYALCSLVDCGVGDVINTLQEEELLNETWIIYTSDHGTMLGERGLWAKANFSKAAVQVPLIIKPPYEMEGMVSEQLVESIDVSATIMDIARGDVPRDWEGLSLMPVLRGEKVNREVMRSNIRYQFEDGSKKDVMAIRNNDFRVTFDMSDNTVYEIYDIRNDPDELSNLASDHNYAEIAMRLIHNAC